MEVEQSGGSRRSSNDGTPLGSSVQQHQVPPTQLPPTASTNAIPIRATASSSVGVTIPLSRSTSQNLSAPSAAASGPTQESGGTGPGASSSGSEQSAEMMEKVHHFRMSCLDVLYSNLCHNLIPHSGKVVVFDSQLPVQHAFSGMLSHDINCAPVWDSAKRKYVGMLSVSDFIDILIAAYYNNDKDDVQQHAAQRQRQDSSSPATNSPIHPTALSHQQRQQAFGSDMMSPALAASSGSTAGHSLDFRPSATSPLPSDQAFFPGTPQRQQSSNASNPPARPTLGSIPHQRICDWAAIKKDRGTSINRLLCVTPEATLHDAVRMLLQYRVHRLCVVQLALADTVLRILTNHGILRFLRNNCSAIQSTGVTIRDLGIGVFKELLTVTYETPLITALQLLYNYKISAIPIVNEQGIPIDVYSRGDVRYLAMDATYNLDMTLGQALSKHKRGRVLPICSRDDTIYTVSGLLVSTMKHALLCVGPDGKTEGVVSLTDIFSFILDSSPPRAESRIAALRADLLQATMDSTLNGVNGEAAAVEGDVMEHKPTLDEIIGNPYEDAQDDMQEG